MNSESFSSNASKEFMSSCAATLLVHRPHVCVITKTPFLVCLIFYHALPLQHREMSAEVPYHCLRFPSNQDATRSSFLFKGCLSRTTSMVDGGSMVRAGQARYPGCCDMLERIMYSAYTIWTPRVSPFCAVRFHSTSHPVGPALCTNV